LDARGVVVRLAGYLVVGWAAMRVALCSARGYDLLGAIALVVLLAFVASITGAPRR
jgi:hypothetical protein